MTPIKYIDRPLLETTALTPYYGPTSFKGLKSWLGIAVGAVAAIAAPFIAPVLAPALFGAGTFFGGAAGSALIGTAIGAIGGAAAQAISGGDITQGALLGGVAGGVGGFAGAGGLGTIFGGGGAAAGAASTGAPTTLGSLGANAAANSAGTLTAAGVVTPGVAGVAGGAAAGGTGSKLTNALLSAAPQAIGALWSSVSAPDQEATLNQMRQQLAQAQGANLADFDRRKQLFDKLLQTAKNQDPAFQARLASADVQRRTATNIRDTQEAAAARGGRANNSEFIDAEIRRSTIAGSAAEKTAGVNARTAALSAQSGTLGAAAGVPLGLQGQNLQLSYLSNIANRQGQERERSASGVAGLIEPFANIYAQV